MARISPLHIDIPSAPVHLHNKKSSNPEAQSPGSYFSSKEEEGSFSFTRNGSQYLASPSSEVSSPMMTPLPFKTMMHHNNQHHQYHTLLTPITPAPCGGVEKDDRKKLREYEFPAAASTVAIKVESSPYQPYMNHTFTQLRQQQQNQLPTPPAAKATTAPLSYSAKYANYTNSSSTQQQQPQPQQQQQQQTVVRVSPRPTHNNSNTSSRKPSTTMALSMIEKEKMTYQYPTHRVSMVSPPPPPYISPSSDHVATTTTQTTTAAIIAIAPPLQHLDLQSQQHQQQQHPYDPTIITPTSLTQAKNKRHSLPVALTRSASSSSVPLCSPSPAIITIAGVGAGANNETRPAPRVFTPKAFSRNEKRHSLAVIPSSSSLAAANSNIAQCPSAMTMSMAALPRPMMNHRGGHGMPPQAIPIFSSGSGSTSSMEMTITMKSPPSAFNPRSSTRLLERIESVETLYSHKNSSEEGANLSALISPEGDHKTNNNNMMLNNNSLTASSLRIASLQRAATVSAAERNLMMSRSSSNERRQEFPGFWEDAKAHNMHWTVYSLGLVAVASLVWVLMLPALMMWVPVFPGAVVLLMGTQYAFQHQYYRQQSGMSSAASSPPRFYSEGYSESPSPPRHQGGGQQQTMSMSVVQQLQLQQQTPSPEYRRSWFSAFRSPVNNGDVKNNNGNIGGRWGEERLKNQRRESSSSIASSETVSSSSTDSGMDSNESSPVEAPARSPSSLFGTGSFSSIPMTSPAISVLALGLGEKKDKEKERGDLSGGDLSAMLMMMPPPPAYVPRRYEDVSSGIVMGVGVVDEKGRKWETEMEKKVALGLPEIAPLGDLMSEFAVDFGAIRY
ncbi:hypothetical protein BGX33_008465 [Mortierella sp. NVP41]|nr:hypothetical protein BGX33_008465 [Mortierella sp. NVP41]